MFVDHGRLRLPRVLHGRGKFRAIDPETWLCANISRAPPLPHALSSQAPEHSASEWASFVGDDLGRRDERHRFLWTVFFGSLAASALLWGRALPVLLTAPERAVLLAAALAGLAYVVVGAPLVTRLRRVARPSTLLLSINPRDETIRTRYFQRMPTPLSHRLSFLAMLVCGLLVIAGLLVATGRQPTIAWTFGTWVLTAAAGWVTLNVLVLTLVPGKFFATIQAAANAGHYRNLLGLSVPQADQNPYLVELRAVNASGNSQTDWAVADMLGRALHSKNSWYRILVPIVTLATVWVLWQQFAFEAELPSVQSWSAVGWASAMAAVFMTCFTAAVGFALYFDVSREYLEQLRLGIFAGAIPIHLLPPAMVLVEVLAANQLRPPGSLIETMVRLDLHHDLVSRRPPDLALAQDGPKRALVVTNASEVDWKDIEVRCEPPEPGTAIRINDGPSIPGGAASKASRPILGGDRVTVEGGQAVAVSLRHVPSNFVVGNWNF